ncbi:MAG: hypothetical protein LC799_07015, partial [Actinobacteria bacterium]|nr:hypothetical protein [Actinomycetota bacterium]
AWVPRWGAEWSDREAGASGWCGMRPRAALLASTPLSSRLLGTGGARSGGRRGSPDPGGTLGDPGWPARVPTLLITIFDSSGSVTSSAGTDPLSNRFAEARHAFSVVARRGSLRELGAVLHFDTPSIGDVRPAPLTRLGLLMLRRGLRVPPGGAGSSELAPSLHRAVELALAHPGHQVTLVVLSDFQLLDPEPQQVLADLAAFPGQVHAVVLGSDLPAGMLDEHIMVTPIGRNDPPGAVARAVFASLTAYRRRSPPNGTRSHGSAARRLTSWIPQRISRHHHAARTATDTREA